MNVLPINSTRRFLQIGLNQDKGKRSLFWVALRFWLVRLPGVTESMRQWLATKFNATARGRVEAYAGLLEVAVLAKYRLITPISLLLPTSAEAMKEITNDSRNPLGLRSVPSGPGGAATFSHPIVAEEILRIAQGDDRALAGVNKDACLNLLDLELHLLARLVNRPTAGNKACVPILEELVTTALRVDPREAPRNYQVRDRIVFLLELAPDSLWDSSQVFNHHLAKARRHLAVDPPQGIDWTYEARGEQLQLAENHLLDAIQHIVPADEERRESPLNLQVSLALTYDARSRLEEEYQHSDLANEYKRKAETSYETAQALDADNSYVLENYARFKLRQAKAKAPGPERTRLIAEAITLLEWEREADESGHREEPTLLELATAYNLLEENNGLQLLGHLASQGSEAALVALAKLALRHERDSEPDEEALKEAEAHLLRVEPAQATWRSRFALYQVVSKLRPYDFHRRLDLLNELDAAMEFHRF